MKKTLFLVSRSTKPCGVETFAREIAEQWRKIGFDRKLLPVAGRPGEWRAIWSALAEIDVLAINLPLVAWKKVLLTPLIALAFALLRGKETILVLHEWGDLDWRRRTILGAYALLARRLVFSSPAVRAQFEACAVMGRFAWPTSIAPIPSNIAPAPAAALPSPLAARLREARADGRIVIGHFGSIYPKKQSDFVLDILAELRRLGRPAFALFIGSFVKGMDNVEEDFRAKADRLALNDDILVSGYVEDAADIHALFQEVDCFVYRFGEGLTSRRGSVLACLQSGKLVIVNAPRDEREFDHHRIYRRALAENALLLLENDAEASDYAALLARVPSFAARPADDLFEQGWRDAASALAAALGDGAIAPASGRGSQALLRASPPRASQGFE